MILALSELIAMRYLIGVDTHRSPSRPIAFLSELATNTTAHNIGVVLYSGNNDALIPHRGTEGDQLSNPYATLFLTY